MILELNEANKLPMKTFRWLGVNELKLQEELPEIRPFKMPELQGINTEELVITSGNSYTTKQMPPTGMGEEAAEFIHLHKNHEMTLTVRKGRKVQEPVFINYRLDKTNPVLLEEIFVFAEENSEVTLVVTYDGKKDEKAYHGGLLYLTAGKNALIKLIQIQLLPDSALHFVNIGAHLEDGGRIHITQCELGGSRAISGIMGELTGRECEFDVETIYFGDKERSLDFNYVANHYGKGSRSNMKVNGALFNNSKKIFRGTIDFKKGASGASGAEEEYILLFDKGIKNVSVPLILCGEEDVSGKHAANSGRIDEDKLFYMMSRGLNEEEAKKMMLEAWFQPALQNIPSEEMKSRVSDYVKERLDHDKSI